MFVTNLALKLTISEVDLNIGAIEMTKHLTKQWGEETKYLDE